MLAANLGECDRSFGRTRVTPAAGGNLAALSPRMAWRLLLMLTRRRSRRAPHFRLGYGATASPSTERNLDQWNAGWGSDDHRYDHNEEPRLGAPGAADCRLCGRWADIEPRLYSDLGKALSTVVEDTCRHDTIYGCCSEPNNLTSCATASAAHIAALAISSKRWRSSGSTAAISSATSISS